MPEMADVVPAELIESQWGNDIRDRTIQRYASAAARSASIPTPTAGDLSYLASTDGVYVWDGTAWVIMVPANSINPDRLVGTITSGFILTNGNTGSPTVTTTETSVLTVTITIPTDWAEWKTMIWSIGRLEYIGSGSTVKLKLRVDSTDSPITDYNYAPDGTAQPLAISMTLAGLTTVGSRTFALRAQKIGSGTVNIVATHIAAIALRTA